MDSIYVILIVFSTIYLTIGLVSKDKGNKKVMIGSSVFMGFITLITRILSSDFNFIKNSLFPLLITALGAVALIATLEYFERKALKEEKEF